MRRGPLRRCVPGCRPGRRGRARCPGSPRSRRRGRTGCLAINHLPPPTKSADFCLCLRSTGGWNRSLRGTAPDCSEGQDVSGFSEEPAARGDALIIQHPGATAGEPLHGTWPICQFPHARTELVRTTRESRRERPGAAPTLLGSDTTPRTETSQLHGPCPSRGRWSPRHRGRLLAPGMPGPPLNLRRASLVYHVWGRRSLGAPAQRIHSEPLLSAGADFRWLRLSHAVLGARLASRQPRPELPVAPTADAGLGRPVRSCSWHSLHGMGSTKSTYT